MKDYLVKTRSAVAVLILLVAASSRLYSQSSWQKPDSTNKYFIMVPKDYSLSCPCGDVSNNKRIQFKGFDRQGLEFSIGACGDTLTSEDTIINVTQVGKSLNGTVINRKNTLSYPLISQGDRSVLIPYKYDDDTFQLALLDFDVPSRYSSMTRLYVLKNEIYLSGALSNDAFLIRTLFNPREFKSSQNTYFICPQVWSKRTDNQIDVSLMLLITLYNSETKCPLINIDNQPKPFDSLKLTINGRAWDVNLNQVFGNSDDAYLSFSSVISPFYSIISSDSLLHCEYTIFGRRDQLKFGMDFYLKEYSLPKVEKSSDLKTDKVSDPNTLSGVNLKNNSNVKSSYSSPHSSLNLFPTSSNILTSDFKNRNAMDYKTASNFISSSRKFQKCLKSIKAVFSKNPPLKNILGNDLESLSQELSLLNTQAKAYKNVCKDQLLFLTINNQSVKHYLNTHKRRRYFDSAKDSLLLKLILKDYQIRLHGLTNKMKGYFEGSAGALFPYSVLLFNRIYDPLDDPYSSFVKVSVIEKGTIDSLPRYQYRVRYGPLGDLLSGKKYKIHDHLFFRDFTTPSEDIMTNGISYLWLEEVNQPQKVTDAESFIEIASEIRNFTYEKPLNIRISVTE